MLLSPLLKTRHLNSKQNLLEVIEFFSPCAQSDLDFKQLHQREIDQKQMSTLLSSFPDSTGPDSILNEHTVKAFVFYTIIVASPALFSKKIVFKAVQPLMKPEKPYAISHTVHFTPICAHISCKYPT